MLNTTASVANNIIIINKTPSLLPLAKPFNTGSFGQNDQLHFPIRPNAAFLPLYRTTYGRKTAVGGARRRSRVVVAAAATTTDIERSVTAKAVVSVKLDGTSCMLGKTVLLEIVSAEADHRGARRRSRVVVVAAATTTDIERSVTAKAVVSVKLDETGSEKETIKAYAHRVTNENGLARYEASFKVPPEFGEVGAVLVENEHDKEMFLTDVVLDGLPFGSRRFPCNSWVHSKFDSSEKRIFFSDKSYLPSQTPDGLKRWRERELENLRGDGFGERKSFERIYDYDTYNDLGDPDTDPKLARPVLGGKNLPYPRRCRTGRPRSKTDPLSESRSASVYVPRDEQFSETKMGEFPGPAVQSVLHAVVPSLEAAISDPERSFPSFTAIDLLFDQGLSVPGLNQHNGLATLLPRLVKAVSGIQAYNLRFEPPAIFDNDRFAWLRDEEFSRQTLAGLNPCSIKLVTEWPLVSKLDPEIYGPPESAITKELVEGAITDFMTLEEAIAQKKLFVLDYHDAFLSYVNKVRELKGTTLYGSRTLFFLTHDGTLRPLAIELARPPIDGKRQWKEVFTPSSEATSSWLWRLAKAHVLAHDSGYHQLISHWLRTHCCTEPYIIAANRQLSAMHPIYRLLRPHFRYTMMMNALARLSLINADGVIESTFSPGKYSFEMCSIIYGSEWRFDHQSLPSDLISRGMAEEDPSSPHGLKLTIEDYPFANDGLVLWDSIKQWVTDYVNHYYPEPTLIQSDQELQAWWTEIRTIGHGDKKDEPWWPNLNTNHDLIEIITNIVWVASGLHAAVNFGQYAYAGYFPNRPTVTRTKIPREDPSDAEWEGFLDKPEQTLLRCFPSQMQATKVMSTLDVLSNHSPDEEYIGDKIEPAWEAEPVIKAAFEKFQGRLKELDRIIDERNANSDLKNRSGAGVVPYELLKPLSEPGVTGMGVPNSISV